MDQSTIFGPLFAMFLLTFVVWSYMFFTRIRHIVSNEVDPGDPAFEAQLELPRLKNPTDNFKNLFEIPVLFYAISLYLFVTGQVDAFYLTAAWAFVGLRVVHSAIHCTVNAVTPRFMVYMVSTGALWVIAGRALARTLGA